MRSRWLAFAAVGVAGYVVQLAALAWFVTAAGWPYEASTVLAVELAVVHNFWWHERWTWADRATGGGNLLGRLARFHASNGAVSIAGNLLITMLMVEWLGLNAVVANAVSVPFVSLANFLAADRWVFDVPLPAHGADADASRLEAGSQIGRKPVGPWRVTVD
jgi:dolichol-phosphate mannosyltransferase